MIFIWVGLKNLTHFFLFYFKQILINMNKYCVVTCIFNNYDYVREPLECSVDCDYYLFTDNKELTSENWNVIYLPEYDTDELLGIQKTYMWKYSLYRCIPNLSNYDYIIRIDGSIQLKESLDEIIRQMREFKYDISVAIHPYRNDSIDEYKAWKEYRGLDKYFEEQYDKFMMKHYHNLLYVGLCENTVQIYKCTKDVFNLLDDCYAVLDHYNEFKDLNDQCYFTDILFGYSDKLRIHYHTCELYIDGEYMCCYEHNTYDKRQDQHMNENFMFKKYVKVDNFDK